MASMRLLLLAHLGFKQNGKNVILKTEISTKNICAACNKQIYRPFSRSKSATGVFEPDNLKLEPDVPEYSTLNLQLRGYDFPVLESYAKYVHRLADMIGFVTEAYPVPAKCLDIRTFKPRSTAIDNKYELKLYERVIQINSVPSTRLPILLEIMQVNAPEGVLINVKEPNPEEEEFRYIPDKQIIELQSQLKAIEVAREERRKK